MAGLEHPCVEARSVYDRGVFNGLEQECIVYKFRIIEPGGPLGTTDYSVLADRPFGQCPMMNVRIRPTSPSASGNVLLAAE
jgi:hypothetical protein